MSHLPDVIHFTCHGCGMALTVPVSMAGVSGPCPNCQTLLTSPAAPPPATFPAANTFVPPPPEPAPVPVTYPAAPLQQPAYQMPAMAPSSSQLPTWQQPLAQQPAYAPTPQHLAGYGAEVPPAPAPLMAQQEHQLLNQLLQTNRDTTHLPSAPAPVHAPIPPAPMRQRDFRPPSRKRGPIIVALLMTLMVFAGVAFFFQDSLVAAYRTYQFERQNDEPTEFPVFNEPPVPPVVQSPQPTDPALKAATPAPQTPAPTPVVETKSAVIPTTAPLPPSAQESFITTLPAPPAPAKAVAMMDDAAPQNIMGASPSIPPASVVPTPPPASLVEVPAPPVPPSVEDSPLAAGNGVTVLNVTPDTQPSVDALKGFFAAKDWRERARYVQSPEQMLPLMEQYYASNPDGPVHVTHITVIRLDRSPETGGPPHSVLQVSGGAVPLPLPVMVEQSPDGWKVDWLTFTEFKDKLLQKYMETFVDTPQRFHVMIRRTHYFDDDIPELEKKICYEITPPVPGNRFYAFAVKGTTLARELDQNLGWEVGSAAVIAELQWRKQDRYQWVELSGLPQYNWRNPRPVAQAAPPVPIAAPSAAQTVGDAQIKPKNKAKAAQ